MMPTRAIKGLILDEDGPTTTEYAVILALIIAVCMAAVSGIGETVSNIFTNLDSSLPTGSAS